MYVGVFLLDKLLPEVRVTFDRISLIRPNLSQLAFNFTLNLFELNFKLTLNLGQSKTDPSKMLGLAVKFFS